MNSTSDPQAPTAPRELTEQWIPFENWISQFGRTRQTGFRWRKVLPWMEVRNIMGRVYISAESARRFSELALSGKLAGRWPTPAMRRGPKKASRKITA